ncbi:MAG: hypothetical protein AB1295_01810 [Candidatus Micrarchaeota archaeon]
MADGFIGVEIAVVVVTASIVLAGLMVGLGRAFGIKRLEHFGLEELIQSVINAAIIGSFAAVIELVAMVSSSVVTESCAQGDVMVQLSCMLGGLNDSLFLMLQGIVGTLALVGYYQGLSLDFGSFAISPFKNLSAVSDALGWQLLSTNLLMTLVQLNTQIAAFIGQSALGLLFPVGLVLRTLFATRKVGGFLIALSLGLYLFYPTFILIFPSPQEEVLDATSGMGNLTSNRFYATIPVIDLNGNYAIAGKLDLLSARCDPDDYELITNVTNVSATDTLCDDFLQEQELYTNVTQNQSLDFTGDVTLVLQGNSDALSRTALYSVIAPLFSLLVTVVFVKELGNILGSEIGLKTFASI